MSKLFLILALFLLTFSCNSKKDEREEKNNEPVQKPFRITDSAIYVGTVLGSDAYGYNNEKTFRRDTLYGLESLTKSQHQVEIRFYVQSYWSDTTYATILIYDSVFEMTRIKHFYSYDTSNNKFENRKSVNQKISVYANPDSVFTKLIENGIFSLTEVDKKDYLKQEVKELTKHGLKDGTQIGDVMDATDFILEYKIDTIFNTIFMHSPHVYFKHNPDYQLFRRYYEITNLMLTGFK